MKLKESAQAMATDGETKAMVSPPPNSVGFCTKIVWVHGTVHDSDQNGVVRILVGRSY